MPSDPESAAQTPFEQSLDRLPADALEADGAVLYYVDLELAWERAGVGAEVDERFERVGSMIDLTTWTQPPSLFGQYFAQLDEARSEVGFTMFDIDREVSVQAPPNNIAIAEIRVSPDDVTAAVETDPLWSARADDDRASDGGYFQWGDDPLETQLELRTPMRPLGQGGQLALDRHGGRGDGRSHHRRGRHGGCPRRRRPARRLAARRRLRRGCGRGARRAATCCR